MTKKKIPKAIREQCWLNTVGKKYETKCYVPWCNNKMTVFDFHVGHDIPESKGGTLDIENLKAICARCNLSMSNRYTIQEWIELTRGKLHTCALIRQSSTSIFLFGSPLIVYHVYYYFFSLYPWLFYSSVWFSLVAVRVRSCIINHPDHVSWGF